MNMLVSIVVAPARYLQPRADARRVIGRTCRRPFDRRSRRSPSKHEAGR